MVERSSNGRFLTRPEGSGRKKGYKTAETKTREAAAAAALQALLGDSDSAEMPKDFMLRIMRCGGLPLEQRFAAARSAAAYCHPQLQAVAHQMLDASGAPLVPQINVNVIQPPPEAPKLTYEGPKDGESVQ